MPALAVIAETIFVGAIGTNSTVTAAIVSGVFLIANSLITLLITRRHERQPPRRRHRRQKMDRPTIRARLTNRSGDPERGRDRGARDRDRRFDGRHDEQEDERP